MCVSQNIRRRFLEFYEKRDHARKPSGSLVPEDPTVRSLTAHLPTACSTTLPASTV